MQMIFVGELLELAGTTPALQPLQLDVTDTSSYPGIVDQVITSNNPWPCVHSFQHSSVTTHDIFDQGLL